MQEQSTVRVVQNFLRKVLLTDLILAILTGFISYFLEIRSLEGYGTLLTWAGTTVVAFACLTAIGGFASRTQDFGAFSMSRAGNMFEHLGHISDARQSSLGCFTLFMSIGLGLVAIGYLFQLIGDFVF